MAKVAELPEADWELTTLGNELKIKLTNKEPEKSYACNQLTITFTPDEISKLELWLWYRAQLLRKQNQPPKRKPSRRRK